MVQCRYSPGPGQAAEWDCHVGIQMLHDAWAVRLTIARHRCHHWSSLGWHSGRWPKLWEQLGGRASRPTIGGTTTILTVTLTVTLTLTLALALFTC